MQLYPDQNELIDDIRSALRKHRRVFVQAPTGSGKTVFSSFIIKRVTENNFRSWFIAPRNKLVDQASDTLTRFGVQHGRIAAGQNESKAFQVHVVSLNTLLRRLSKIIREPDFLIFDEAHVHLGQILTVQEMYPRARVICLSATPERGDGRGLNEIADVLVEGPQLSELVKLGRLSPPRYFFPDLGIDTTTLTWNGTEANADELAELFAKQKIYGRTIDLYRKHSDGKPCILFERRVKSAQYAAAQFREAGYNFQCVDGSMSPKKLQAIFDGFKRGEITGLTSSDLLTYGVDLPTIECLIMLRPTKSVALYFQMIGRGLRLAPGKDACVILDQVNNIKEFGYPLLDRKWNFKGDGSGGIIESEDNTVLRLCPEIDFMYCNKRTCAGCEHNSGKNEKQKPVAVIDCELTEYQHQEEIFIKNAARPAYQEDLDKTIMECRQVITAPAIARMVKYAKALGEDWRWVYGSINQNRHLVNVALVNEIGRAYGYKAGWAWHKVKELREEQK